jgi:hypothetical protein
MNKLNKPRRSEEQLDTVRTLLSTAFSSFFFLKFLFQSSLQLCHYRWGVELVSSYQTD